MISNELLAILVCPENRTPLSIADEALMSRVRLAIRNGALKNRAGEPVTRELHGGLVREDGAMLYGIVDGIPILLIDEAIPLDQLPAAE